MCCDGDVVVTYRDREIKADHIEYDTETGELTANGHLHVTGGANHEDISGQPRHDEPESADRRASMT